MHNGCCFRIQSKLNQNDRTDKCVSWNVNETRKYLPLLLKGIHAQVLRHHYLLAYKFNGQNMKERISL